MKQASRLLMAAGLLGPAIVLSSCSGGGGSGGGVMYIQSCTLGCSNGEGGAQVSCGIINTFQNQDISVSFSQPVDGASLTVNNSFQVVDTVTGALPPGTRLVDANNPNRAIFRPRLAFDSQGNPSFGFAADSSYQIRIPGTSQNDTGPFVASEEGQDNQSRLLCTITTDQGLIDPVPGAPSVDIVVDVEGVPNPVNVDDPTPCLASDPDCDFPQPPGTVIPTENGILIEVDTASQIRFIFNDLMNIGTVVLPSTGQSPFITIKTDGDGNPSTINDQVTLGGTYEFFTDQTNLKTVLTFTPSGGLPSAGNGIAKRLVVIDVPAGVRDLAGNAVANLGTRYFAPEVIQFGEVTLPAGGEQFTNTLRMDAVRTGADWGEGQAGRLKAGLGGGSGRLGDLSIPDNASLTVYTEPQPAVGRIRIISNPTDNRKMTVSFDNGTHLRIRRNEVPAEIFAGDSIAETSYNIVSFCSDPANQITFPELAQFSFELEDGNTVAVRPLVNGPAGDGIRLNAYPDDSIIVVGGTSFPLSAPNPEDLNPPTIQGLSLTYSSGATAGGVEHASFGPVDIVTDPNIVVVEPNLFLTNSNAGQTYINIVNGIFEFTSLQMGQNSTLRFVGANVPRVFARGRISVADTAAILIPGVDQGAHGSEGPAGQYGGRGGPGGGRGGRGGDRPHVPTTSTITGLPNAPPAANPIDNNGIQNPTGVPDGRNGSGVGGTLGYGPGSTLDLGLGIGGVRWPTVFPTETNTYAGLVVNGTNCDSRQLGAPGSGGAFSTDGVEGVAISVSDAPVPAGGSFTPPNTAGGDSATVGLESPLSPGPKRALRPALGYLRGGSGGGGAGAHTFDTGTAGTTSVTCFNIANPSAQPINIYRTHSGAGGGGGGGAIQLVAGRFADFAGRVDVSGGDGGSVNPTSPSAATSPYGGFAQPGGGGSGGAILLQSRQVSLSPLPNRLLIGGGTGGVGPTLAGAVGVSSGGAGGVGLVRIEDASGATTASSAAAVISPTDPLDPTSVNWLSVATWPAQTDTIDAYSGAQSCWLTVPGNPFSLTFASDAPGDLAWDMDLFLTQGPGETVASYRESTFFGGMSPEQHWGNLFDDGNLQPGETSAPLIVRFQGAKSTAPLSDPCNVTIASSGGQATGLTPWVLHPEELNNFTPRPDIVRWQIIFDASHPDAGLLRGVTNLRLTALPD
jgi:hypothetical protein